MMNQAEAMIIRLDESEVLDKETGEVNQGEDISLEILSTKSTIGLKTFQ